VGSDGLMVDLKHGMCNSLSIITIAESQGLKWPHSSSWYCTCLHNSAYRE